MWLNEHAQNIFWKCDKNEKGKNKLGVTGEEVRNTNK